MAFPSSFGLPLSVLFLVVFVLFFGLRIPLFAEQPIEGFFWGAIGGCYGAFSSLIYRSSLLLRTSMSDGACNMNYAVEVARVSAPIASPLHKLNQSLALEDVQMALDRPDGA